MYVLYDSLALYETMRKIMVCRDKPLETIKYQPATLSLYNLIVYSFETISQTRHKGDITYKNK
jgi:hypothetical protein